MGGPPVPSRPALHRPRGAGSDLQAGTRPESRRADDLDLDQAVADIDDSIHRLGPQRLVPEQFVCAQSRRCLHTQRTRATFRRLRARGLTDRCPSPAARPGRTADQFDRGIGERSGHVLRQVLDPARPCPPRTGAALVGVKSPGEIGGRAIVARAELAAHGDNAMSLLLRPKAERLDVRGAVS
jgi:hypothetical protein